MSVGVVEGSVFEGRSMKMDMGSWKMSAHMRTGLFRNLKEAT